MMRDVLSTMARPLLAGITEHPFWVGLRNGTLPASALWYFAEQDARYLVPTYARALARATAIADCDAHAAVLCAAANASFEAVPRMGRQLAVLSQELGKPAETATVTPAGATTVAPADRTTHAHTCFMLAAAATSFAAGIGGLLPMSWFHLAVSGDLREHGPGNRYAAWINQYCPGEGYQDYIEAYLTMIDEVGAQSSAGERDQLIGHFLLGADHERAFADAAWRHQERSG